VNMNYNQKSNPYWETGQHQYSNAIQQVMRADVMKRKMK